MRCVVGPEFSSGRRVKMSVHNVMTPVLLNNIFSSLEGRVEPGTPHLRFIMITCLSDRKVTHLISARPVHHTGSSEGLAGSRSRQVWSRDSNPAGAGSDLLRHGEER